MIHAVGHRAAQQSADQHGHQLHQAQQADLRVGVGELVELPGHGDVLGLYTVVGSLDRVWAQSGRTSPAIPSEYSKSLGISMR